MFLCNDEFVLVLLPGKQKIPALKSSVLDKVSKAKVHWPEPEWYGQKETPVSQREYQDWF